MNADDIPTEITKLTYGAPGPALSQKGTAELLAHYWPAIEQHIRAEVGEDIKAFGEAAGRAQDPTKIGYLGGLAVAETIARGTEPDLNAMISALRVGTPTLGAGQ